MKKRLKYTSAALLAVLALGISIPIRAADADAGTNITNIVINNITEDTGLELGTDARARGQGSIATGKNSLAIGKNAVATGGNETQDSINAKLNENKQRLQDIADAEANTSRLLADLQNIRKVEADVLEAGERVKQVQKAKATAYDRYVASQTAYNDAKAGAADFLREAQAKIDDLNSRLTGVSKLTNVNINSDEGLTSAATQLKSIAEEGTTLDLSVDFYKDYVSSYYQALGDIRLNEAIVAKTQSNSFSGLNNSNVNDVKNAYESLSSLNSSGTSNGVLLFGNLTSSFVYGKRSLGIGSGNGISSQGSISSAIFADNLINKPTKNLIGKNVTTEISSLEEYQEVQSLAPIYKLAFKEYLDNSTDPFLSNSTFKNAFLDMLEKRIDLIVKSQETAYYQGQYESTNDVQWLDKKKIALNEYNDLALDIKNSTSINVIKSNVISEWKKEHVDKIKEKNKITTNTLTSELEKALGINKNAVRDKEAEIERLKQAMDQAKSTYDNTNPSAADLALSQRYEQIMAELTAKASELKAEQERLNALKSALTLHDLTNVGENALAIGTNALTTGTNAMAIGTSAIAVGENAIAIGKDSAVTGNNSIAVGVGHIVIGNNSGTFGDPNTIYGDNSYAIGNNNTIGDANTPNTVGTNTFVLGSNVTTTANNAVILGNGSTADADNVVSVGAAGSERKIIHVAAGELSKTSTDAVNGSQLFDAMQNAGKTYTAGTNITISDTNVISAAGTGTNAAGDTGLITGDTLYQTISNITNTTNANLAKKADKDANNLTDTDVVSWQEKLGNGKNAKGDAGLITGDTLYSAIDGVNTSITNKADINLTNITNDGKTIIRNLAKGSVKVVDGTNTTVTIGADGDATTYAVNVTNDAIKGAIQADLDSKANRDATNLTVANKTSWKAALGDGVNVANDTGLITGNTLHLALNGINTDITNINNTLNQKADITLKNITNEGKTVIRNIAKGSVKVVDGTNTTVTIGTDGDATTYAVNVTNDAIKGAIQADLDSKANRDATNLTTTDKDAWKAALGDGINEAGNTGLITGDTLHQALENATNTTNTNLAKKADKDAGNLTDSDVAAWQEKLGNGKNSKGDTGLITGDTLNQAIENVTNTTNVNLSSKANINLTNITNEGKTVIRNIAKESVKVVDGTNTTVTIGTAGDATTYAVNVSNDSIKSVVQPELDKKADKDAGNLTDKDVSAWQEKLGTGTISEGNTGLVTGGSVYDAIKDFDGNGLVKTDGKVITIDNTGTATTIDVSHTVNGVTEGRVLTGVLTDTSDATSVVNVGTLAGALDAYGSNVNRQISSLDRKLSKDIGKAGAAAAALAALKPLSYDPANKLNFAVGQGHYRGQNSTALGVFYTPNEDVQINFGGTVTGSDKAINGGVSFRIGSGNKAKKIVKTSEFNALKEQNAAMAAQLAELSKRIDALQNQGLGIKLLPNQTPFPDVPASHWANTAVETLHGNAILTGYPDGYFHGDRTMTRYEYAQMLYKALQKGAYVDQATLEEYAPELAKINMQNQ